MSTQVYPVISAPNLYINGFEIKKASNTSLTIGAGECRDSNNVVDLILNTSADVDPLIYVTAPLTLTITTVGANGVDATATASTVYKVFIIGSSQNQKPIACIATNAANAAPVMPFGYDSSRLVGYFVLNASTNVILSYISGTSDNRYFTFDVPQATAITAGNATAYTAVTLTTLVPAVDNLKVKVFSALTPSAAGRGVFLQGANSVGDAVVNLGQVTSVVLNSYSDVLAQLVTSTPRINYKVSNASDAVALSVAGFEFFV